MIHAISKRAFINPAKISIQNHEKTVDRILPTGTLELNARYSPSFHQSSRIFRSLTPFHSLSSVSPLSSFSSAIASFRSFSTTDHTLPSTSNSSTPPDTDGDGGGKIQSSSARVQRQHTRQVRAEEKRIDREKNLPKKFTQVNLIDHPSYEQLFESLSDLLHVLRANVKRAPTKSYPDRRLNIANIASKYVQHTEPTATTLSTTNPSHQLHLYDQIQSNALDHAKSLFVEDPAQIQAFTLLLRKIVKVAFLSNENMAVFLRFLDEGNPVPYLEDVMIQAVHSFDSKVLAYNPQTLSEKDIQEEKSLKDAFIGLIDAYSVFVESGVKVLGQSMLTQMTRRDELLYAWFTNMETFWAKRASANFSDYDFSKHSNALETLQIVHALSVLNAAPQNYQGYETFIRKLLQSIPLLESHELVALLVDFSKLKLHDAFSFGSTFDQRNHKPVPTPITAQTLSPLSNQSTITAAKQNEYLTIIVERWCSATLHHILNLSTDALSDIMLAFNNLQTDPSQEISEQWSAACIDKMNSFTPQQLIKLITSFNGWRKRPKQAFSDAWFVAITNALNQSDPQIPFTPAQLTVVIDSLASLVLTPSDNFIYAWCKAAKHTFAPKTSKTQDPNLPSQSHLYDWNDRQISTTFHSFATLRKTPDQQVVDFLFNNAFKVSRAFAPSSLSTFLYSIGVLRLRPTATNEQEFWRNMFYAINHRFSYFNQKDLAYVVYGIAASNIIPPDGFLDEWSLKTVPFLHFCDSNELTLILYAVARFNYKPSEEFMSVWFATAKQQLADMPVHNLSNLVYACGNLKIDVPSSFMAEWYTTIDKKLPQLSSQGKANMIYGLMLIDQRADNTVRDGIINRWFDVSSKVLSEFSMDDLAKVCIALLNLDRSPSAEFVKNLCQALTKNMNMFPWPLLVSSLRLFGSMRIVPSSEYIEKWINVASQAIQEFSPPALSRVVMAFGTLGLVPGQPFMDRWFEVAEGKMSEIDPQSLSDLCEGLAILKAQDPSLVIPETFKRAFVTRADTIRKNTFDDPERASQKEQFVLYHLRQIYLGEDIFSLEKTSLGPAIDHMKKRFLDMYDQFEQQSNMTVFEKEVHDTFTKSFPHVPVRINKWLDSCGSRVTLEFDCKHHPDYDKCAIQAAHQSYYKFDINNSNLDITGKSFLKRSMLEAHRQKPIFVSIYDWRYLKVEDRAKMLAEMCEGFIPKV